MKVMNDLTAEVLKCELERHRAKDKSKNSSFDDFSYIQEIENAYKVRFIGIHISGDKLNLNVYKEKGDSGQYTTGIISLPNFRKSDTALRFANSVSELVLKRVEIRGTDTYSKMKEELRALQEKEIKAESVNDAPVNGPQEFYDPNYYKKYLNGKNGEKTPTLEELTLTVGALNLMPDLNKIRTQARFVKNNVVNYASKYVA
jgi:hypothetical protein